MSEKSKSLAREISIFKEKIKAKNDLVYKFEPNKFDLFIDDILNIISDNYRRNIDNVFVKNFLTKSALILKNSFSYFLGSLKNIFRSLNNLEKKIETQQELLNKTIEFNKLLSIKISEFDQKLEKTIFKLAQSKTDANIENINEKNLLNQNSENTKLNIIQEENLRISNELYESRKKIDIMREEVEKYNKQRTELINKINSVNEIVNDSNVLTSVFDNNLKNQKIKVLDPSKPIQVKNLELEVKAIFSKKK